jgi:UDP-N-acetylglucosamine transferase subunit ALG13
LPLIQEACRQGALPVVASAGDAGHYLQQELPALPYIELPAYNIRYPYQNMVANMAIQLPKIARATIMEHRKIQRLIATHHIQAIVSDNRFGCWSSAVPSIFLSHQLQLRTPVPVLTRLANTLNHYLLKRYDQCWIPDRAGEESLSGALSVPPAGLAYRHLGLLSRFTNQSRNPASEPIDVLALLSGPEPQRTYLEKELLPQLRAIAGRKVLVRGTMVGEQLQVSEGLTIYNYLGSEALGQLLAAARVVVCRSGYSSLMDLSAMGKRVLLIPTPGQTEQEYLASRLFKQGWAAVQRQGDIHLREGIAAAERRGGLSAHQEDSKVEAAIRWLIASANSAGTRRNRF